MSKPKSSLLKNGFWIKEQDNILTIGSLNEKDDLTMVLSPELSEMINGMEKDMVEAIYGDQAVKFIHKKDQVDFSQLLTDLAGQYSSGNIKMIVKCADRLIVGDDYESIIGLLKEFVEDSINFEFKDYQPGHIIMDVSVLSGNLCILYRDNGKGSGEERLGRQFDFIRNKLNGEVSGNSRLRLAGITISSYLFTHIPKDS